MRKQDAPRSATPFTQTNQNPPRLYTYCSGIPGNLKCKEWDSDRFAHPPCPIPLPPAISGSVSLIIWGEHGIHCMSCTSEIMSEVTHGCVTIVSMEWQTVWLSALANVILVTSLSYQYDVIIVTVTFWRHWYRSMADSVCSAKVSITLQTEIL